MRKYALVVDDQYFTREIIGKMLADLSYEVIEAADGEEAVRIFRNSPQQFNLITMDYNMPLKNGVEAIREIRGINERVPIIGISASASAMRMQLRQLVNIPILSKPINKLELEMVIKELEVNES